MQQHWESSIWFLSLDREEEKNRCVLPHRHPWKWKKQTIFSAQAKNLSTPKMHGDLPRRLLLPDQGHPPSHERPAGRPSPAHGGGEEQGEEATLQRWARLTPEVAAQRPSGGARRRSTPAVAHHGQRRRDQGAAARLDGIGGGGGYRGGGGGPPLSLLNGPATARPVFGSTWARSAHRPPRRATSRLPVGRPSLSAKLR